LLAASAAASTFSARKSSLKAGATKGKSGTLSEMLARCKTKLSLKRAAMDRNEVEGEEGQGEEEAGRAKKHIKATHTQRLSLNSSSRAVAATTTAATNTTTTTTTDAVTCTTSFIHYIVLGVQKGGTMAAVKNLNKHPDIFCLKVNVGAPSHNHSYCS
jgi:hypothetical protein